MPVCCFAYIRIIIGIFKINYDSNLLLLLHNIEYQVLFLFGKESLTKPFFRQLETFQRRNFQHPLECNKVSFASIVYFSFKCNQHLAISWFLVTSRTPVHSTLRITLNESIVQYMHKILFFSFASSLQRSTVIGARSS